ncbi:MAG: molybdate ABC transporter permease subunit [Actinobacteria bacterium]|nr:molybdate ABC transporter permease subunit [Actinomycetota bacterium]
MATVTIAFFALPLLALMQRARWSTLWSDLTTGPALDALRLSVACAAAATALSLVFGTPLAWVLARTRMRGRRLVRALVLLPMILPPVVGGVALLAAFSLNSPLGGWLHDALDIQLTFSPAAVIMAQTFVAMPFYVITVEGALSHVDPRFEDVAGTLGAGPLAVFRKVTLPLIAPSVAAGAVLAFARALGEFGATVTFAGNIAGRTQTLPLAVYLRLEADPPAAIALSFVLVAVAVFALVSMRGHWFRT